MTFKGDLIWRKNSGSLEKLSASYEYFAAVFQKESYYESYERTRVILWKTQETRKLNHQRPGRGKTCLWSVPAVQLVKKE